MLQVCLLDSYRTLLPVVCLLILILFLVILITVFITVLIFVVPLLSIGLFLLLFFL